MSARTASAVNRPVSAHARCTGSTHIRLSSPNWRSTMMPSDVRRAPSTADSTAHTGTRP